MKKFLLIVFFCLISFNALAKENPKIITIGGALTEIVYALDAGDLLVGSDTSSYYPEQANDLEKVGYQRTLSAEGILSLHPDFIILTEEAGPEAVLKQIKSANVEIVKLKSAKSISDVKYNIKKIAQLLNRQKEVKKLIAKIESDEKKLAKQLLKTKGQKVLFILNHDGKNMLASGSKTAADAMIKLSGGSNAIAEYQGYKQLNSESILEINPQIILTTTLDKDTHTDEEILRNLPSLKMSDAVKNNRIIVMDSLYLLGFGPRVVEAALDLNSKY